MYTLVNQVSVKPLNCNVGYVNSWLSVINNAQREFCAQAAYITNFDDMMLTLSAGNVNIGAVEIKDWNSNLRADVITDGGYNALRVLSQDLEASVDDITIGDRNGNFARVNSENSALNVFLTNNKISLIDPITAVQVLNPEVTVLNPITAVQVLNPEVTVLNPITAVQVLNPEVTVLNPITAVQVLNPEVTVLNPITAVQISNNSFSELNFDAFNRLRSSQPFTLFDSSHRYSDNGLWDIEILTPADITEFDENTGTVELNANISGQIIRTTKKVFSYQPGKSLLILNTFTLSPSANGLTQKVGYFDESNGIFLQLKDDTLSFVKRSSVTGSITDTEINQNIWNVDKMDGSGPSGITLDITKSQIFWIDVEWLGVGTVRCGFVIDGRFILCHSFHHANQIEKTYMATACLPVTYSITNSTTEGIKTLTQICTSVISEGGYELNGNRYSTSIPITDPYDLEVAGTYYPVISIRLKNSPDRSKAIAILKSLKLMGIGNGINYSWKIVSGGTTTGGSWLDLGSNSSVEYNISATSFSGGKADTSGFINSSNQGSPTIDIGDSNLFRYQLERSGEMIVCVAASTASEQIFASIDWEEITR